MRERLDSVRQLFSFMNDVSFPYVVLRNWENLPDDVAVGAHSDLDLLVYDRAHFLEIFPMAKAEHPLPRARYSVPVSDSHIFLDVREAGDGYYPQDLCQAILEHRELSERAFFTPSPQHFRVALAYHAVHHKGVNTYPRYLGDATVEQLLQALKEAGIGWEEPSDPTVGRFHPYAVGATAIVEKADGHVVKRQRAYRDYDLLANEARCLEETTSSHFPKVLSVDKDRIELEDCGVHLTSETMPDDWREQLVQILLDLQSHGLEHRDIKPDNLMVKDGIIKLIDFGWARRTGDAPDHPPLCLGVPYRPSWGPDDHYAMRKVIKELEFQREELLSVP